MLGDDWDMICIASAVVDARTTNVSLVGDPVCNAKDFTCTPEQELTSLIRSLDENRNELVPERYKD